MQTRLEPNLLFKKDAQFFTALSNACFFKLNRTRKTKKDDNFFRNIFGFAIYVIRNIRLQDKASNVAEYDTVPPSPFRYVTVPILLL